MDDPVRNPYLTPQSSGGSDVNAGGSLAQMVRVGQIITFALVQGVLVIGGILLYITLSSQKNPAPGGAGQAPDGDFLILAIGSVAAVVCCIAAAIVPVMIRRKATVEFRASGEKIQVPVEPDSSLTAGTQKLVAASHTSTIVGQAFVEGAAVMNLIFMMINENLIHLGIAVACVVGILLQIPTVGKVQQRIENAVR